jgi:hypothetical protein
MKVSIGIHPLNTPIISQAIYLWHSLCCSDNTHIFVDVTGGRSLAQLQRERREAEFSTDAAENLIPVTEGYPVAVLVQQ